LKTYRANFCLIPEENNHSAIQEVTETASICGMGFVLEQTNDTIIVVVAIIVRYVAGGD
jgi:hypothetical protein